MTGLSEGEREAPSTSPSGNAVDGLRMAPELMVDLAPKAAELVVERIEGLPEETAWDGEFRQVLEARGCTSTPRTEASPR